jgi:hypothetical protein
MMQARQAYHSAIFATDMYTFLVGDSIPTINDLAYPLPVAQ